MRYFSPLLLLLLALNSPELKAYTFMYELDATAHPLLDGRSTAKAWREGSSFYVDVSAIAHLDAQKLLETALDYEKYDRNQPGDYHMPNLVESHLVQADPSTNLMVMWSNMNYMNAFSSSQYMSVRVDRTLPNGGLGMKWQLIQRRSQWIHEADPAFSRMDGSFFILPQADGTVYMRYFGLSDLEISLPRFVSGTILNVMKEGASQVVEILARQARNR